MLVQQLRIACLFAALFLWVVLCVVLCAGSNDLAWAKTVSPPAESKMFVVKQKNGVLGNCFLYLCDRGVKVDNGKIIIVAAPPDWKVVMVRLPERLGVEFSLEKWSRGGLLGVLESKYSLKQGETSTIFNSTLKLRCLQIIMKSGDRFIENENDSTIFRSTKKLSLTDIRYQCTSSPTLAAPVRRFLCGFYNVPDHNGIPVELTYEYSDGSTSRRYFTESITQAPLPASSFFAYPTNFKHVGSKTEVLFSDRDKVRATTLLKDLMDDEVKRQKSGKPVEGLPN